MPNLRDFERRLGGLVEGLFSKTFRSGVQPVELAKRLIKEMDAERTVGPNGVWAPNHFEFALSAEDAERFEQAETALASELAQVAREKADARYFADGTREADEKLQRVLTCDPGSGVVRHADAGYPDAIATARESGIDMPMLPGNSR